jgi:hypothetical protein
MNDGVIKLTPLPCQIVPSLPLPGSASRFPAKESAMLAEIFIMRIEMQLRIADATAAPTSSDKRFVPVTLPRDTSRKTT